MLIKQKKTRASCISAAALSPLLGEQSGASRAAFRVDEEIVGDER